MTDLPRARSPEGEWTWTPGGSALCTVSLLIYPDYPDFAALMRGQGPPSFLTFDLLAIGGRDVCDEPLETRKHRLADLMSGMAGPVVQNSDGIIGEGRALFDVVKARGMEGVVAKRLGSRYAPGRRTGSWVKIKVTG